MCIRWVVLLDLHLHPFCSRPNSQEEHKRKHGPHGDDDQRFSLSSKGGEGDGSAEGEKDREWRRRSSKRCRVDKQSRKSREISRWTCRRDVHRPVVKRREGGCFCRIPEAALKQKGTLSFWEDVQNSRPRNRSRISGTGLGEDVTQDDATQLGDAPTCCF